MRGTHDVHAQFILQDVGVLFLDALRHRIANVRITLMAVKAAKFQQLPVEVKTAFREPRFAEAEIEHDLVQFLLVNNQFDLHLVQIGIVDAP